MTSRHAVLVVLLLAAVAAGRVLPAAAQEGIALPVPAVDLPASPATSAVMVVAGGCFWGVQGVFQHVKGVSNAVSGYAGGAKSTAVYELTNDGTTGHAESVHQDFLVRNPDHPYIIYNDLPKIATLKRLMPTLYRAAPVLVSAPR